MTDEHAANNPNTDHNTPETPAHDRASSPPPRLVLIPGLGTDARVFEPQRRLPARVEVPDWLEPLDHEPLPSYARRLAATVNPDPPMFIGGVSLGSMIALEMAKHLPARAVFVIGGTRDGSDVSPTLHAAARLGRFVPRLAIRRFIPIMARKVQADEGLSDEARRLFRAMLADLPVGLLKWQAVVACAWELTGDPGVPEHAIHGELDTVIKRAPEHVDRFVPGGFHLINYTHPAEVNAFIEKHLNAAT